mgnify:CR=1 FL=1|tara:strand:+ start:6742 stop:7956 length:1215 start_codon:yes stop_codon:yes gene_type:complete
MKLSVKIFIVILLMVIPFNFIAIEGIGNVYLSTIMILITFSTLFLVTKGQIILNDYVLFAVLVFVWTLVVTVLNIIYSNPDLIKLQITNTMIYFQTLLVFIIAIYFYDKISYNLFLRLFLIAMILSCLRVIIEEPNHILKLSTRWEERIEAYFIGGVNNFSLFVGIAFIISFFQLKKGAWQIIYCLFFLLMIVLGMSRGALLGVILTLFITSLYDMSTAKFKLLMKYTFYSLFSGFMILLISGKIDEVTDKIQKRFFSLFTGEQGVNDFFSARGDLLSNIFNRLSDSSILQILFGHGNGGIDFYDYVSHQQFKTSHNLLVDVFYRNGIILCLIYVLIFVGICWMFMVKRTRNKVTLFGIFVFFHLELLVNPVLFAAQVGWVYALFMVYFLNQNSIKPTPINRIL